MFNNFVYLGVMVTKDYFWFANGADYDFRCNLKKFKIKDQVAVLKVIKELCPNMYIVSVYCELNCNEDELNEIISHHVNFEIVDGEEYNVLEDNFIEFFNTFNKYYIVRNDCFLVNRQILFDKEDCDCLYEYISKNQSLILQNDYFNMKLYDGKDFLNFLNGKRIERNLFPLNYNEYIESVCAEYLNECKSSIECLESKNGLNKLESSSLDENPIEDSLYEKIYNLKRKVGFINMYKEFIDENESDMFINYIYKYINE